MNELIKNIPVVALRGMTLLPSMITHFDISREKSVKAVETAMLRDQKLVVVTQKSPETQDPGRKDLHKIGTLVTVKQIMKLPQNIFRVLAEGLERVEVMDLDVADGCLVADAATFSEEELALPDEKNQEAMVQTLRTIFQDYCQANGKISRETALQIMEQTDLQKMVDQIAVNIPVFYEEKQKLLEAVDLTERFEQLFVLLENERDPLYPYNFRKILCALQKAQPTPFHIPDSPFSMLYLHFPIRLCEQNTLVLLLRF